MKVVLSPATVGHGLALAALALLAGCDSSGTYPRDLRYPQRTDPLVLKKAGETVLGREEYYPTPPGKFEEHLRQLTDTQFKEQEEEARKSLQREEGESQAEFTRRVRLTAIKKCDLLDPKYLRDVDLRTAEDKKVDAPRELRAALNKYFGTPARPRVEVSEDNPGYDTVVDQVLSLQLDPRTLRAGSQLYRHHCLHCHGLAGDGRGPTGPWVSPHPRDYRQGLFKFTSTGAGKPSRGDLYRTVHNGLDGSTMPSFAILPEEELEHLVSYVIHLSLRGQVEFWLIRTLLLGGELTDNSIEGEVQAKLAAYLQEWMTANDKQIKPKDDSRPHYYEYEPDPQKRDDLNTERLAAVARGYKLFVDPQSKAICMSCHRDYGRQVLYKYDAWGTLVRPNNLTAGIYRAGRRPIDHYWRIRSGIGGTAMSENTALSDKEVWDVVAFIQALPYPGMLPDEVRKKVYGGGLPGEIAAAE